MADVRPQYIEEAVGASHPTKADVINRAWNVEHDEDGTHGTITPTAIPTINLTGGQIAFPATAVPSADPNTQDDYEEGYHAPVQVFCSTDGDYTVDAGNNNFAYTKIGRVVHVQGYVVITGENAPNGQLRVSMPITAVGLTEAADRALGILAIVGHGDAGIENPYCYIEGGLAYVSLYELTDAGVFNAIDEARVDTAFTIYIDITYIAA